MLTGWVNRLLPFEFEITHTPDRVLGFADYLSRHPSEIRGNTLKAENMWKDWFTVNTITKNFAISEEETTPSDVTKWIKLPRAPDSVLRVENKQSERQSKIARKHEGNQQIKSLESEVRDRELKIIPANNNSKMSQRDETNKTAHLAASESIEKLNKLYLPANYQANKKLKQ